MPHAMVLDVTKRIFRQPAEAGLFVKRNGQQMFDLGDISVPDSRIEFKLGVKRRPEQIILTPYVLLIENFLAVIHRVHLPLCPENPLLFNVIIT